MNDTREEKNVLPTDQALLDARILQQQDVKSIDSRIGLPWRFWILAAAFFAVSAGGFFFYQQIYKKQAEQLLPSAVAELSAGNMKVGLAMLREAAAAHNTMAQYKLAEVLTMQYLLQNGHLPLRAEVGGELFTQLDRAVLAGNPSAAYLSSVLSRAAAGSDVQQLALLGKAADGGLFIARLEAAFSFGRKYAAQSGYLASLAEAASQGWHVARIEQAAIAQDGGDMIHARQWLEQAQQEIEPRDSLVLLRRALKDADWQQLERDYRSVGAYRLAMMMHTPSEQAVGLRLLQKAADAGLPAAHLSLAKRYLDANKGSWEPEKARELLENLAKRATPLCHLGVTECAGSLVSQAKFTLAVNHYSGVQGFESVASAYDYLKEGNEQGEADATYMLGWVLLNGRGVPADIGRGLVLITQAATAGITGAKVTLAKCYLQGLGVSPSREKARSLLQEAAAKGDEEAVVLLQKLGERGEV